MFKKNALNCSLMNRVGSPRGWLPQLLTPQQLLGFFSSLLLCTPIFLVDGVTGEVSVSVFAELRLWLGGTDCVTLTCLQWIAFPNWLQDWGAVFCCLESILMGSYG